MSHAGWLSSVHRVLSRFGRCVVRVLSTFCSTSIGCGQRTAFCPVSLGVSSGYGPLSVSCQWVVFRVPNFVLLRWLCHQGVVRVLSYVVELSRRGIVRFLTTEDFMSVDYVFRVLSMCCKKWILRRWVMSSWYCPRLDERGFRSSCFCPQGIVHVLTEEESMSVGCIVRLVSACCKGEILRR